MAVHQRTNRNQAILWEPAMGVVSGTTEEARPEVLRRMLISTLILFDDVLRIYDPCSGIPQVLAILLSIAKHAIGRVLVVSCFDEMRLVEDANMSSLAKECGCQ